MKKKLASLAIMTAFMLSPVIAVAEDQQLSEVPVAEYQQLSEVFTFNQRHKDMIQTGFDNVVSPSYNRMGMDINTQDIFTDDYLLHNFIETLLSPVYDVLDEIIEELLAPLDVDARLNIILDTVYIPVEHPVFDNIRVSVESQGDFIVTNIGYSFLNDDLKEFLNPYSEISSFNSQYNRTAFEILDVKDPWSNATAVRLRSSNRFFVRDDGMIFIDSGSISGSFSNGDNRLVQSVTPLGGSVHNNGTRTASSSQLFTVEHINPNTGLTDTIRWNVVVRP